MQPSILAPLAALVASAPLTLLLVSQCTKREWVAHPRTDRWHQASTALYGGGAIWAAICVGVTVLAPALLHQHRLEFWGLAIGGTLTFAIGLWDDIKPLNPLVKLTGQVIACTVFLVGLGLAFGPGHSELFLLSLPVALLWMLGLTNAFNLLDNMDGLAAGSAAVISSILGGFLWLAGVPTMGAVCAVIAGSCAGFLLFNFRPAGKALIFMGDCGSMLLGFLLAGLALIGAWKLGGRGGIQAFAVPLLVMAVPIFDTTLVTIRRKVERRPISQGGRDHSSHRLVYSGLTEKQAVLALLSISALMGSAALLVWKMQSWPVTIFVVTGAIASLGLFGGYLARFGRQTPMAATGMTPGESPSGRLTVTQPSERASITMVSPGRHP